MFSSILESLKGSTQNCLFLFSEFVRMMVCEADPLKDKLEKKNKRK